MIRIIRKSIFYVLNTIKLRNKNVKLGYSTSYDNKTHFEGFNRVGDYSRINNSSIGRCSYIGSNTNLDNCAIGRYCCIASFVKVIVATHPVNFVSIHPVFFSTKKQCGKSYVNQQIFPEELSIEGKSVLIGNDVWIGQNVILMGGLKIGDGAVIGTGAIVTKDVPAYAIVGGVPAKLIKYRFSEDKIQQLAIIKWWNKPEKWIIENAHLFTDIDMFCRRKSNDN